MLGPRESGDLPSRPFLQIPDDPSACAEKSPRGPTCQDCGWATPGSIEATTVQADQKAEASDKAWQAEES